jgi:adenylyltransferase/sulfurtransferase
MPQPLPLEISCDDVQRLRTSGTDFMLLDCRERDEHELVRIGGATLLPMSELMDRAGELAPHKARRLVVHCHHGGRSMRVAQWLRGQGFEQVQSMAGGIDQWAAEIEPGMPRY